MVYQINKRYLKKKENQKVSYGFKQRNIQPWLRFQKAFLTVENGILNVASVLGNFINIMT